MGRLPNAAEGLFTRQMGVFTKLASVKDAKGSTIFVIAGLGKPKRYYLWEAFTIEDVPFDGTQYTPTGPGWVLLPPPLLQGKDFDKFKSACANFVSFRSIDDLPYRTTLRELAERHHTETVTPACETFCDELIQHLPKNGDAYYYRAMVRQRLGKADGAREDFQQALKLGTNFFDQAQAGVANPEWKAPAGASSTEAVKPAKKGKASSDLAAQVVSKGVFASPIKKPAGVSDAAWRAILQRRGQEDLRQKLIKVYGGRCAITGYDGEAMLEVAFIDDEADGPTEVANALLLRGDVRTLFDLNLIRIHPQTRKILVADSLARSRYAKYRARQLRSPESKEDRPKHEALQRRWELAGGTKTVS